MKYLSVCSGIEAATCAWESLGWTPVAFSEIEKFPSAVLAHHYPAVANLGDMTKIAAMVRAGIVAAPDVLVGGTPCQAFSIAGLRASMDDARGQLTLSFVDLANAIDSVRHVRGEPESIIVWENVPGVLSTSDNAFGCFLGAIAGEDSPLVAPGGRWSNAGCVYGPRRRIAWRTLDAQYTGVAQRRRRVFVVASARNGFDPTEVLFEFDGVRRDTAPRREAGQVTAPTLDVRAGRSGETSFHTSGGLIPIAFGGNNQSGSIDVATARNASASTGDIAHCLNAGGMGRQDYETETMIVQAQGYSTSGAGYWREGIGALRGRTQDSHENVALSVALRGREGGATAELGDEVATCLRASGGGGGDKAHVLAPIAFDSRQDTVSSTELFGALGSSSPQAQAVCITSDITHTLKADGFDASEDGIGQGQPIVAMRESGPGFWMEDSIAGTLRAEGENRPSRPSHVISAAMAVRRLTPVECERLQGFPDGHTFIPTWNGWRKMDSSETPESCVAEGLEIKQNKKTGKWRVKDVDGPRYKALGNSMAVPVMNWIGSRIQMVEGIHAEVIAFSEKLYCTAQ